MKINFKSYECKFPNLVKNAIAIGSLALASSGALSLNTSLSKDTFERIKPENRDGVYVYTVGNVAIGDKDNQIANVYTSKKQQGYVELKNGTKIEFPTTQNKKEGGLSGFNSKHYMNVTPNSIFAQAINDININTHDANNEIYLSDCNNANVNVSEGNSPNKITVSSWDEQVTNVNIHLGKNDTVYFPEWGDSQKSQKYTDIGTYTLKQTRFRDNSIVCKN